MKKNNKLKILYIVVPCYNEQDVLPITSKLFINKIEELIKTRKIDKSSKVLFVNDGSNDNTWDIIKDLSNSSNYIEGICLSRNRGHQNALLAGLMEAKDLCDAVVSIDCDGQDDINAIDEMIGKHNSGYEIVYGVRAKRDSDTFFKRFTAESFYKLLNAMGVETIYNHADYRLVSSKVLNSFESYKEVNLFLRGIFPLIGYKSDIVYYDRQERIAGESHYPLSKMMNLAFDGITSLSIKPITYIIGISLFISIISFIFMIVNIIKHNDLWIATSLICMILGIIGIFIGIIGEYIGKAYIETKHRPRYIISERTY